MVIIFSLQKTITNIIFKPFVVTLFVSFIFLCVMPISNVEIIERFLVDLNHVTNATITNYILNLLWTVLVKFSIPTYKILFMIFLNLELIMPMLKKCILKNLDLENISSSYKK